MIPPPCSENQFGEVLASEHMRLVAIFLLFLLRASGQARTAPESRYTLWNSRYWEYYGSRGYFTGSNLNQMDLLMGVSF